MKRELTLMTPQLIGPIDRQLKDEISTSLGIMYCAIKSVGSPCVSYKLLNILAFFMKKINLDVGRGIRLIRKGFILRGGAGENEREQRVTNHTLSRAGLIGHSNLIIIV